MPLAFQFINQGKELPGIATAKIVEAAGDNNAHDRIVTRQMRSAKCTLAL